MTLIYSEKKRAGNVGCVSSNCKQGDNVASFRDWLPNFPVNEHTIGSEMKHCSWFDFRKSKSEIRYQHTPWTSRFTLHSRKWLLNSSLFFKTTSNNQFFGLEIGKNFTWPSLATDQNGAVISDLLGHTFWEIKIQTALSECGAIC